jgi:hypothetical protein
MSDIIQDARQFAAGIALGGEVENMAVGHIEALARELEIERHSREALIALWEDNASCPDCPMSGKCTSDLSPERCKDLLRKWARAKAVRKVKKEADHA